MGTFPSCAGSVTINHRSNRRPPLTRNGYKTINTFWVGYINGVWVNQRSIACATEIILRTGKIDYTPATIIPLLHGDDTLGSLREIGKLFTVKDNRIHWRTIEFSRIERGINYLNKAQFPDAPEWNGELNAILSEIFISISWVDLDLHTELIETYECDFDEIDGLLEAIRSLGSSSPIEFIDSILDDIIDSKKS
jgi:hypothetical protein